MSKFNLSDLITGGIDDIAETAFNIIDEFIETPDEKRQASERLEQFAHAQKMKTMESVTATVTAQSQVMQAEMNQGDNYTKRARPTLVYAGLVFIFLAYLLFPALVVLCTDATQPVTLTLPTEFWYAWGGVCSVWCIGRSAERIKPGGLVDKLANTTEPYVQLANRLLGRGR